MRRPGRGARHGNGDGGGWPQFWAGVAVFITGCAFNTAASVICDHNPNKGELLPDVLFDRLPEWHVPHLNDAVQVVLLAATVARFALHPDGRDIFRRYLLLQGVLWVIRPAFFSTTRLPNPYGPCREDPHIAEARRALNSGGFQRRNGRPMLCPI